MQDQSVSTLQNGLEYLKQRSLKGMGRVDGIVLIKFPSPHYFPKALKLGPGLILFLLLLIFFCSAVSCLERIPTRRRQVSSLVLFPPHWLACPIWANITRAIELLLSNFLCCVVLLCSSGVTADEGTRFSDRDTEAAAPQLRRSSEEQSEITTRRQFASDFSRGEHMPCDE